jgi:hypothetical protein
MAFLSPHHLTSAEIADLLSAFEHTEQIAVTRIRYRNKQEIRQTEEMSVENFKQLVFESIEEEHLSGGDLEIYLPTKNQTLVGHHDGVYWLEPKKSNA